MDVRGRFDLRRPAGVHVPHEIDGDLDGLLFLRDLLDDVIAAQSSMARLPRGGATITVRLRRSADVTARRPVGDASSGQEVSQ